MFQFHAARPPRPVGVLPANRALPHLCGGRTAALPRPLPPPPPPLAAPGSIARAWGEAALARQGDSGDGAGREEAAVGNAMAASGGLVGDTAEEAVAGPAVAVAPQEKRGSGGVELDRKRGLDFAAHPPPKRRAVSAKRQFPPGCGRDAPPPPIVCNGEDGSRVGAALSRGDLSSSIPEQVSVASPPAGTGGSEEGGLRLEPAPANAALGGAPPEKVTAAVGGAPVSDGHYPGPETTTVTSTPGDGELGMKESTPITRLPPKRRMVSANRRFPPGCGRDAMASLASRGGIQEAGLQLELALPADGGLGALEEVAATNGGRSDVCAMVDTTGAVSKDALDGIVEVQELEEGEIPTETDHILQESQVTVNNVLHELKSARHECAVPLIVAAEPSMGHISGDKMHGNMLQSKGKSVSWAVAENVNVLHELKSGRRECAVPPIVAAEPSMGHISGDKMHGNMLQSKGKKSVSWAVAEDVNVLHELKSGRDECAVPPIVAPEPSMGHISNDKMHGNMVQCKGKKSVSWAVAEDVKVMNEGSSPKVATKPYAQGPPKEYLADKKVSEGCRTSLHVAAGVQGQGIMRSKVTLTARKAVKLTVEANKKPTLVNLDRPYSTVKETESGATMRESLNKPTPVNLDRPYSTGKETESGATMRESLAPRKKLKVIGPVQNKQLPANVAPTPALHSKTKLKDKEASPLDDDEIWKEIACAEGKLKMYLNNPSCVPSVWRHMQHGGQTADARSKVKMICRKFQFICRTLVQDVEQRSFKSSRIDLAADKIIRKLPGFTKHGPIMGIVPGVEIGDEFLYRVELAIVGLHRPYQGGIDSMRDINGMLIAISIVASGGYPDELSSSGEIIYTGSGGKPAGKKENEDQKLVRGNLALKNCIQTNTPVRVIHGFKGPNREEGSHSMAKEVSTFTYDGLYNVVDCWHQGEPGSRVFKYRLQRITGQPELPLHVAKGLRKSVVRPGLCIADISQGKEKTPICVINTIDNARPASFKYITRNRGPSLTAKRSQGCGCTDGCSNSANCACIVKNGGEIPFNFNGAVVHAKPLIFECGPSCKCPPSCHNRVSQLGMKIPLEVFRTTKTGWGVRSLRSISSGSFICEYAGELLHDQEADQRSNDDYLFDIGRNYDIWKEMPSAIPGPNSSGACSLAMEDEGFTIDAAEYGSIGRFINHSCSPNLYAQNVLWDHDDKRVPHIMFFAAENISPLQELTYDYNYEIGQVHDVNGGAKVKYCHCGSAQCRGRLY